MRFEIRRLHDAFHFTTVYVTHDQGEAMVTSDRIAVMNAGRIEQIDPPYVLYTKPRTRFVAGFIGRTNLVTGTCAGATVAFDGFQLPRGMFEDGGQNAGGRGAVLGPAAKHHPASRGPGYAEQGVSGGGTAFAMHFSRGNLGLCRFDPGQRPAAQGRDAAISGLRGRRNGVAGVRPAADGVDFGITASRLPDRRLTRIPARGTADEMRHRRPHDRVQTANGWRRATTGSAAPERRPRGAGTGRPGVALPR